MSETSSQEITKEGDKMIDLEAIQRRNAVADVLCERGDCPQFRCAHTKADIDALLAEVERLRKLAIDPLSKRGPNVDCATSASSR